jgi:hypothetical protein
MFLDGPLQVMGHGDDACQTGDRCIPATAYDMEITQVPDIVNAHKVRFNRGGSMKVHLWVMFIKATGVQDIDSWPFTTDPYAQVEVKSADCTTCATCGNQCRYTSMKKSLNPVWNEKKDVGEVDLGEELDFYIYDSNTAMDTKITGPWALRPGGGTTPGASMDPGPWGTTASPENHELKYGWKTSSGWKETDLFIQLMWNQVYAPLDPGNGVRITDGHAQKNAFWFTKTIPVTDSFRITFEYKMARFIDSPGAGDGFAFVLTDDTNPAPIGKSCDMPTKTSTDQWCHGYADMCTDCNNFAIIFDSFASNRIGMFSTVASPLKPIISTVHTKVSGPTLHCNRLSSALSTKTRLRW